jgi:sodium-dependent dicarboxylate transporter 2/3/5
VLMLLPISLALIHQLKEESPQSKNNNFLFPTVLLLAIAYGSSLGGMATPVGTPPNIIFMGIYAKFFPDAVAISFFHWMFYMIPLSIILLLTVWTYLAFIVLRKKDLPVTQSRAHFRKKYRELGSINVPQKWVLGIFLLTALMWIFRSEIDLRFITFPGWPSFLGLSAYIQDSTIAMGMSILLFIVHVPHDSERIPLLKLQNIFQIPWDILLLFGGGFALAEGIQQTGLAEFVGEKLKFLEDFSPWMVLYLLTFSAAIFTEFTSNTAVATTFLPITAVLATSIHFNPLVLMLPVTIASSCAFMLPVSTPPNAVVFGTRYIPIKTMVKIGSILLVIVSLLVSLYFYFIFYLLPVFNP